MKNISEISLSQKSSLQPKKDNKFVKDGYMKKELVERMLSKMRKHINFFMYDAKDEDEFDERVNDWFRYLRNYRQTDVYQVYDLFMTSNDDKVELRAFIQELKSIANRNAIDREQQQRKQLAIGLSPSTKESAKSFLSKIKSQVAL